MDNDSEQLPPSALVSWAHKNSGWDDTQAEAWISHVLQFASLLVENGIDAKLDLWNDSDTQIDWTRWGPEQVAKSDFVIIAISQAWKERWQGSNNPTQGAGAVAEANALKGRFNTDQGVFQKRTIIVLLPGSTEEDVPEDLHHLLRITVDDISLDGIEDVLRALFASPKYEKPPLGSQPTFSKFRHSKPTPTPSPQDVASKRAELDAEDGDGVAVSSVHFERPSAPPALAPTAAEELSRKLDAQILERVFQSWDDETELFRKLSVEPTRQLVVDALGLAIRSGLISALGPRISIFDTSFVAAFTFREQENGSELTLHLETEVGELLARVPWTGDIDEVELLAILSQRIFEQPQFDGALGFFPSSILSGLSDLLVLASEARKGWRMGSRHAYRKLIQQVDDFWVISEDRIFPKDRPYYTIAMSRINEMDWSDHIKGKRWEGESGIDEALQIARKIAVRLQDK